MIDQKALLRNTQELAERLQKRGVAPEAVVEAQQLVRCRNKLRTEIDGLRAESKRFAKENQILLSKEQGSAEAKIVLEHLSELKSTLGEKQEDLAELEERVLKTLESFPNVPDGVSYQLEETSVSRVVGNIPASQTQTHDEIGRRLGILDFEGAVRVAGSNFSALLGDGARLLRALENLALDLHRTNYREVSLPHMVNGKAMWGSGHFPKFQSGVFEIRDGDLIATPTAEIPLVALHQDQRIPAEKLPLCYVAQTSCFRKEVGSGGAQSRGMRRLHEYNQVELMRFCTPEQVEENFACLLADAIKALDVLGIPYRTLDVAPEDLPFAASRAVQIEVYSRGGGDWLSVSTASLFSDFQARRSNIRFTEGKSSGLVITMNASAIAASRLWGILVEHGYDGDGTIKIPEALHSYMGKSCIEISEEARK